MLFNSHIFIFLFLPIVIIGFYRLGKYNQHMAALWLVAASLFFYGWWDSRYVGLLLGSIIFNYGTGYFIGTKSIRPKTALLAGIMGNLACLIYYKYSHFFIGSINQTLDTSFPVREFILPLGISFFTFTQIAFLVDTYQGKVKEANFVHYALFVTYFPHLIAGPVLHHKEMMPQFAKRSIYKFNFDSLLIGLMIFFIGLFKKTVLADNIAKSVGPVFDAASSGMVLSFLDAWGGALSYTFQLYFDFSGYSDMALGLSRMFGVKLPLNFHSPYKAVNIIEFWRRWHMTLSRFLRDYLYIPLGGSRKGKLRRYLNLMTTMLLGGLWHGAGWTYVAWGGLHGLYLVINHSWQRLRGYLGHDIAKPLSGPAHVVAGLLTFLSVTVAWVLFRAENISTALAILESMSGINGLTLPNMWLDKWGSIAQLLIEHGVQFSVLDPIIKGKELFWILISLVIVWLTPNTQQIMANFQPALDDFDRTSINYFSWTPSYTYLTFSILIAVSAILSISDLSEFIYFQF